MRKAQQSDNQELASVLRYASLSCPALSPVAVSGIAKCAIRVQGHGAYACESLCCTSAIAADAAPLAASCTPLQAAHRSETVSYTHLTLPTILLV